MPYLEKHVFICTNQRPDSDPRGSCAAKGSEEIREAFKRELHNRGLKGRIRANAAGCLDQCANGCAVVVYPDQVWYGQVKPEDVGEIVEKHLVKGQVVTRLLMADQPHLRR